MDLVDRVTGTEGLADDKDTAVSRLVQRLVDVGNDQLFVFHEAMHTLSDHAETFLDRFFEGTADRHHLSYRLHARPQFTGYTVELTQVPARYLTYHIVECRFEESAGRFRYRVLQVEQAVAQT